VKEFWSFIILLLFLQMCFSKGQISTEKKEDRKWDTSYPWNAWRDVSMPFNCTSERSISTVVVLGNTVAGTARSDSPPEPSLKLSGNPPSKLVMAVGSCTRISSIFGVLIKNYTVVVKKRFFDATEQNQNKKPTSRCNTIRHATKAYILLKRESAVSGSNRRENCKTEK
jgi:hypothetical protein